MAFDRWEYGSSFRWIDWAEEPKKSVIPHDASLFATGRDAIRVILKLKNWNRCWVPSYFCQEVTKDILTQIPISFYEDSPLNPNVPLIKAEVDDLVLIVNYFGLRNMQTVNSLATVIEDHSHDPWSEWAQRSTVDYCIASLRKTLPVPDGGILWSPKGLEIPRVACMANERRQAFCNNLSAMLLKQAYLNNKKIDKDQYRNLQSIGEKNIAGGNEISGISNLSMQLLSTMPWEKWREKRMANYEFLKGFLEDKIEILEPYHKNACPFSIMLKFESGMIRDDLYSFLINNKIYPAILWPIENDRPELQNARKISQQLISIPCDFRYGESDLKKVGNAILRFINGI